MEKPNLAGATSSGGPALDTVDSAAIATKNTFREGVAPTSGLFVAKPPKPFHPAAHGGVEPSDKHFVAGRFPEPGRASHERDTLVRLENPVLASHKNGSPHVPYKAGSSPYQASTMTRKDTGKMSGAALASGAGNFHENGRGHCSELDLPSYDKLPVKADLHRPDSVITTSSIVSSETGDIGVVPPPPPPDVYTISGLYGANISLTPSIEKDKEVKTHKRSTSSTATNLRAGQMTHKRSHSHTVGYNHKRNGSSGFVVGHRRTASGALVEALDSMTGGSLHTQTTTEFLQSIQKQHIERSSSKEEEEEVESEESENQDCGYLACQPSCIQPLASIKVFVLLLSMLVTLQQALSSGYLNSVITTIEKRYEIPSSISGLIASVYEIGNVGTVIFVSYLGSRRHIPIWIGTGVIMMGVGSIIFSLPHFLSDSYSSTFPNNITDENICKISYNKPQQSVLDQLQLREFNILDTDNVKGLSSPPIVPINNQFNREDNCIKEASKSSAFPIFIFMIAQLFLGCGGSPLLTLGTTYIDDHVKRDAASMYIGFMYSMVAFGPVLGFLLGAFLLRHYVDTFSVDLDNLEIDSSSRHWVGMWWGGFLICGILMLLISIPFFAFPKVLKREKRKVYLDEKYKKEEEKNKKRPKAVEKETPATDTSEDYGKDLKDLPRCIWKLITNWIYLVTCMGACMELVIVSGFIVFLPKYLETQFALSKSEASMLTGGTAIPGACIGIFLGGYILKRLQLKPRGAVQLVLFFNFLCLCCYGMLFFFGCNNIEMAGATSPYSKNSSEQFQVNLTASCNLGCSCDMNDVQPVCGANGLTYFSPCHAGCTSLLSHDNYTNCACVGGGGDDHPLGGSGVTKVPVATAGPCYAQCQMIFPFMVLLFFMTLLVAVTQMPVLMVVLRSVEEEEKAFALGIQFVIFRLFGYIPSPIMFGNVIDSTCLVWKQTCEGSQGGRCLMYDIELFRYKYVGICAGIKTLSFLIFLFDWWLIGRRQKQDKEAGGITMGDMMDSIVSVNKVVEEEDDDKEGLEAGMQSSSCSSSPEHTVQSPTRQPMIPSSRSK